MMPAIRAYDGSPHRSNPDGGLSPREWEVMRFKALGYTEKEIAHRMGLTTHGVKNRATAAYTRLGFNGEGSMVRAFRALGWLQVPE